MNKTMTKTIEDPLWLCRQTCLLGIKRTSGWGGLIHW